MYGNNSPRGGYNNSPPVNPGDELTVTIEAVGEKGDGVAKVQGFVLFVPNVKEGETVKIKVTKVLRKVGFAEVVGKGDPAEVQTEPSDVVPPPEAEGEQSEEAQPEGEQSEGEAAPEAQPEQTQPQEGSEDTEDFGDDLEKEEEK